MTTEKVYPNLSSYEHRRSYVNDPQDYRIQKVCEVQKSLEKERDERNRLTKRYNKINNAVDITDMALTTGALGLSVTGVTLLTTIVAIPISIVLEGIALGSGLLSVITKITSKNLASKAKKHQKITVLADSKINTVQDLVSKALTDGKISEEEFSLILEEEKKFKEMKEEIRLKANKKVNEGLIEKGRNEFRNKLIKVLNRSSILGTSKSDK